MSFFHIFKNFYNFFLVLSIFLKKLVIFKYKSLIFVLFLIIFSFQSFSEHQDLEVALKVFEKAITLSPELLNKTHSSSVTPFYKIGKNKIYLTQGFWDLTRAWIRIYKKEIEKHCPCDFDSNLMIEEAKNYLPQSFLKQKFLTPGKNVGQKISYKGSHLTAKYGYIIAGLKLSAEVAETILSVFIGGKGVHIFCNAIDVMIFPLARGIQKHVRVFSYGRQMNASGFLTSFRMAWLSHKIKKSQKKVFFHIHHALNFREQELNKINQEGPKSFFHKKGHRLLWIESLKKKTDPLFEKIKKWEQDLENPHISLKEKNLITKKIIKTQNKIEKISKINRKDFFGKRFKRYLLLVSRKNKTHYMAGKNVTDTITKQNILWPLSLQENVIERALLSKFENQTVFTNHDEIKDGLIDEFLSKQTNLSQSNYSEKEKKEAIQFFLEDIETIFNANKPQLERLVSVYAIEMTLTVLFAHYLKISSDILSEKYQMSFKEKIKLQWAFGRFSNLTYNFSDFLFSVAIIKNKEKTQFYKYESMEKTLAFFSFLQEIQKSLKDSNISKQTLFKKLNDRKHHLQTLSLSKEKRTSFSLMPFKTKKAQCKKLVEKYQ